MTNGPTDPLAVPPATAEPSQAGEASPRPPTVSMRPPPGPTPPPRRSLRNSSLLTVGCVGFFVLLCAGVGVAGALSGSPSVDEGAVLKLTLRGEVPEHVRETGLEGLIGRHVVTVHEHLVNLQKAAADKRVKGVVLRIEPLLVGWAKVEELRDALVEFRKSGKFVIAYAELLDEKGYALALGADQIVMPAQAPFEFNGLASDFAHYPGLLEKLGIDVQYFRFGKYKSVSGEQLGRKGFTEPVQEMIEQNLELTFDHFVDAVAKARRLDPDQVRQLIDEGHLTSTWAADQKLIDRLAYWDELEDEVRTRTGVKPDEPVKWVSAAAYTRVSPRAAGLEEGRWKVALLFSQGLIVAGQGGEASPFGDGATQGSAPLVAALRRAVKDDDVKAILFRVDSPGGAGLGCDFVRREIERARAKKPVIVSMSDVAASGGYWVSMDATAIVAQPTTATGSIGIFSVVPSLGGLYEKLGLNNEVFKRGAHADALIGARAMTEAEARRFDDELHESYVQFVSLAAKGRNKPFDEMQQLAQGRTWYGADAAKNGLVDRLGGFPAALALAREKAGLAADEPVQVEVYEKERSWLEELGGADDDEDEGMPDLGTVVVRRVVEAAGAGPLVRRVPGLAAFAQVVLQGRERLFPMMEHHVDFH